MVSFLPSIPYPEVKDGYWSPVTSTLNWCEEDYYATHYAAEIVNTLTNVVFVILAAKGIRNCLQNGHDKVFLVSFCTYLIIGLGSVCFHATLKYSMQLVDELSMIYTACTLFFATFSLNRPKKVQIALGIFSVLLAASVTAYYHYLKDPVFHQNAFALLCTISVVRSIYDMENHLRAERRDYSSTKARSYTDEGHKAMIDKRDSRILGEMWKLVGCGLGTVALGFLIWTLDNAFCSTLRTWRRSVGLPWGILLEGHGWWHVFTGLAMYYNLNWGIWLRYCLKDQEDEVELIWPSLFTSMPVIVRKSRLVTNGSKKNK